MNISIETILEILKYQGVAPDTRAAIERDLKLYQSGIQTGAESTIRPPVYKELAPTNPREVRYPSPMEEPRKMPLVPNEKPIITCNTNTKGVK